MAGTGIEILMTDVRGETTVTDKGERLKEHGPHNTANSTFPARLGGNTADSFELVEAKEHTLRRTLREIMQTEQTNQCTITDILSKKFVRLMDVMSKRKLGGRKLWLKLHGAVRSSSGKDLSTIFQSTDTSSEYADRLTLLCDQAEATLGELLMRAGASFTNPYGPHRYPRLSSLSQIMRLSGRVICGSATQDVVKDEDSSTLTPLASEGEMSSQVTNYVVREVTCTMQGNSSESLSSTFPGGTDTTGPTNGRNTEIGSSVLSNSEERTNSLEEEDSIHEWWSHSRELIRSPTSSCGHSLGGNTRLNTIIAESPMLAHAHGRSSDVSVVEVQPFESFLVREAEEPLTSVAVGTPTRVSLMSLLQETQEAMVVTSVPIANGEGGESWDESMREGGGLDPMCCVCMVGRKGAAFIPCGHTFCRTCTRELWRARRACPLCNKCIVQILDLY